VIGGGVGLRARMAARMPWWVRVVLVAVTVTARWFTGAPLNGERRSDATFWHPATEVAKAAPGWFTGGLAGRWSTWPGWRRAALRWLVSAVALGLVLCPWPTLVALGAAALAGLVWFGFVTWSRLAQWQHYRTVVRPLYRTISQYLGTPINDRADKWVMVPRDYAENHSATIQIQFPDGFDPHDGVQRTIKGVVRRHIGAAYELQKVAPGGAVWRRVPPLVKIVYYAELAEKYDDPFRIPVGKVGHGRVYTLDLTTDSPHYFVSGSGGSGKTSHLRVLVVHVRRAGWLVDIIDRKQSSFYLSFDEVFPNPREGHEYTPAVHGVRVHIDTQSSIWAMTEFFLSMVGVNTNRGMEAIPRMLIFDEFGSFKTYVDFWWRSLRLPGAPPVADLLLMSAYQGRQGNHRIVIGAHDASKNVFRNTDTRNMFDGRGYLGPHNLSRYRTTYGAAPMVRHDSSITGRGLIALGEEVPEEIQYAYISEPDARAMALAAPVAPEWFTRRELPPWVTAAVIAKVRAELGTVGKDAVSVLDLLWTGHVPGPDQTCPIVPGRPALADTSGAVDVDQDQAVELDADQVDQAEVSPILTSENTHSGAHFDAHSDAHFVSLDKGDIDPTQPRLRLIPGPAESVIRGIGAAAEYLRSAGWPDTTDQGFDRARTRWRSSRRTAGLPPELPGETADDRGRPLFTASGLRQWQASRARNGIRQYPDATA